MTLQILVRRMDSLEHRVKALETLPERLDRLESQIVQFRAEVRGEFSAVRAEMGAQGEQLRAEINAGDEETRRLMRVLHEDVISRFAIVREAEPPSASRRVRSQSRHRSKR